MNGLPVSVLSLPLGFEVSGILVISRLHSHDDPAILQVCLVSLGAIFGDAGPYQRANESARRCSRSSTRKGSRKGAGDQKAEARNDQ